MQEVSTKYPGPLKTVKGFTIDEKEKYILKNGKLQKISTVCIFNKVC